MPDTFKPDTPEQVRDAVAWAVSEESPLEIVTRATKRTIGRPLQTANTLDLSGLSGIGLYEAEELICQAGPGTTLAEIEAALKAENQRLAFEPMDLGVLLGPGDGRGEGHQSIAGVFACNLAGPRRIKDGAARDHLLGFTAVTGRGEIVKSGGRVVKNVTGYDLSKLVCGSWGTLAALTDLTFKVLPAPETETTLLLHGLDEAAAVRAMSAAMGSAHDVSSAAHLPADITAGGVGGVVTALRVEGIAPSVVARVAALTGEMAAFGVAVTVIEDTASTALWRDLRDARPLAEPRDRPVWKISVAPMVGPRVVAAIRPLVAECAYFYDWAGGLVWLAVPPSADASAGAVRRAVDVVGGHATLIRAAPEVRAVVDSFHPQSGPIAALAKRVKDSFDPKGVLNPGRMTAGA
ncbi:MAG: FAD-binding protein [Thalassobaculaceae bacterium]|nr:FAD-binding protein [Thalassobaculaceae bacterium]